MARATALRLFVSIGPFFALAANLCLVAPDQAQTTVSGVTLADTKRSLANSPYTVTADVPVSQDATLPIEMGATVKFDAGTKLLADVGWVVCGTAHGSITLTSMSASPAPRGRNEDMFALREMSGRAGRGLLGQRHKEKRYVISEEDQYRRGNFLDSRVCFHRFCLHCTTCRRDPPTTILWRLCSGQR